MLENINYAYKCTSTDPVTLQGGLDITRDNSGNPIAWGDDASIYTKSFCVRGNMDDSQYLSAWKERIEILRSVIGHTIIDIQIEEDMISKRKKNESEIEPFWQGRYLLSDEENNNINIYTDVIDDTDDIGSIFVNRNSNLHVYRKGRGLLPWSSIKPYLPENEMYVVSIDLLSRSGLFMNEKIFNDFRQTNPDMIDRIQEDYNEYYSVQPLETIIFNCRDGYSIAFDCQTHSTMDVVCDQERIKEIYKEHDYCYSLTL